MKPGIEKLAHKVLVKWSAPLTIFLLLLSGIGFYLGSGIQLKLSLTDLLPEEHPAVVKFNKLTEVVGGVGYFAIILTAEDEKTHLEVAPKLVDALKTDPLIRDVFFKREQKFFVDRLLYYSTIKELEDLDSAIKRQIRDAKRSVIDLGLWEDKSDEEKESDAFSGDMKKLAKKSASISPYLTSKDMKHLLVMVKPSFDSTDLDKSERLIKVVEGVVGKLLPDNVTYEFSERYYKKVIETKLIQRDIFMLGLLAIVLILIVLLAYIRNLRALIVVFAPIAMSLGITVGITRLFIGHINIVTGFLMGVLSGLGVDYAIHLYLRLPLERREPSIADPDPVWRSLFSAGHAIFVGAMAAAFAFYVLIFSSFKAFSEFGFVCGTGIVTVFICLMCTFSTFVKVLKVDKIPLKEPKSGGWQLPLLPIPGGMVVGCLVTLLMMGIGTFVRFEYDFDKMMRHSVALERSQNLVDEIYDRSNTPSAFAAPDKETALAVEAMLKEKYIPDVVSELISGASIIPENQKDKAAILKRIDGRLSKIKDRWIEKSLGVPGDAVKTWVEAKPFEFSALPSHLQDALRGKALSGYLLYIYPAVSLSNAQGVRTYAKMIRDVESVYPKLLSGSDAVVFSDILDLINHDGAIVLWAILICVGLFIWINMRRLDDTLASYLPLLFAFPVGMGFMVLFDVKFNIFNICIIPAFVAIGIDIPLHVVHRAREVGSGFKAARDLAPSANLALLTTGLGFGVMIFANAGILKSLGWIAILGTSSIWWVALIVLPAVLEWYFRRTGVQGKAHVVKSESPAKASPVEARERLVAVEEPPLQP